MAAMESSIRNNLDMAIVSTPYRDDPDVCNKIYSLYNRKIFNTAYRILGEESSAEDALQETMLNVFRGISSFRGDAKISTWISRITINVCLGMLRKEKRQKFVELDAESTEEITAEATPLQDPLEYASSEELKSLIFKTFRKMTEKQAIVVRLHDMQGYTIEEIARIIRCPIGTVKSRLFYGRQEFKTVFQSLKYENLGNSSLSVH